MTIQDRLMDDLKIAMKAHGEVTKLVVRMVRSAVHNVEIEKREAVDDAAVTEVLSRIARQYRESIGVYQQADRVDLVAKEEAELEVWLRYLPEQLGPGEVLALVKVVVDDVGAKGTADKGKVMGKLMPQLRGKADGGMVNTVVTEHLESLGAG